MPDPSWRDVLAYLLNEIQQLHSPWPWIWLAMPLAILVRILASLAWRRHVQQQQVAIVESILKRWLAAMDHPFPEMSPEEQRAAIDRLEHDLVGDPAVVLPFLLAIQVSIETLQPRDDVIAAIERLARIWHDKLPSDRKRRARRAEALARRDVARLVSRIERDGNRMASPP